MDTVLKRIAILLVVLASRVGAEVSLPAMISDHMVLQRSPQAVIWGRAAPGEAVRITLAGLAAEVRAGEDGRWQTGLDTTGLAAGPHTLDIQGSNTRRINDVLIGEVWLCSGQSNMEQKLRELPASQGVSALPDRPAIRQFLVDRAASADPKEEVSGRWITASPQDVGQFSAVGYYFAADIQDALEGNPPVGIINSTYGASCIEAWTSFPALLANPAVAEASKVYRTQKLTVSERSDAFSRLYQDWAQRHQRPTELEDVRMPGNTDLSWSAPAPWPASATEAGLPHGGIVRLKTTLNISPQQAGNFYTVRLGAIDGFDQVYWNGPKIGETTPSRSSNIADSQGAPLDRRYDVPAREVREGPAEIVVRLLLPAPSSQLKPPQGEMGNLLRKKQWSMTVEETFSPLTAEAQRDLPPFPEPPKTERLLPAFLYNGMIHPLLPYTIRGVLWYQGEANARRADEYEASFQALIKDWRTLKRDETLPFYFCQLANFHPRDKRPVESEWAELREAQSRALALPHTGQAVLLDIGEEKEIHYADKKTAGVRLARIARRNTYGQDIPASGPTFAGLRTEGDRLVVKFENTGSGLTAHPLKPDQPKNAPLGDLEGFAITEDLETWVWANARIVGPDEVAVWSGKISHPLAVRYGWSNNPVVNLSNDEGLPAAPFRTDANPRSTHGRTY